MKYVLLLLFISSVAHGQTTYYIRADSTRLQKVGGNNELILENGTRTRTGAYLKNISNGRTGFFYAVDSAYISGGDLIVVRGNGNLTLTLPGGSVPISSLTAATGTNTINNGAHIQEWQWNTLSSDAFYLSSSTTVGGGGHALFNSLLYGANASSGITSYAAKFNNTHTGTTSTNVAGYFNAQSATNNYAIIVPSSGGSVGIGTSTPAAILHTVGTVRHATLGTASTDTTANKPLGIDSDGDIIPMTYWPGGGGTGGSADSSWVDVKNYFTGGVTLASSTRQQRIDAWQACIADAQTKQYGIKFSGAWDVRTDSLIITDKLVIQGVGNGSSLTTTDNTGTLLTIDITTTRNYYSVIFPTYKPVVLQDFQVRYLGVSDPDATSIGIKNTCTASFNFQQRYERVTVDSFYTGIKHHNIASSHIYECYFRNNRAYGFLNTNDESQDYGKMVIDKCVFTVSAGIAGQPDTSAHIKWEGGAGLTVTNCDLYGGVDEGVWVNLQNTSEAFASAGSTEYSFKDNRVLFVNDYAFLFDTDFGKGGPGTSFDGNKIQDIQVQNNMTGINGLLKTVGGTASIFDVQVTGNTNIYPYLSTAKIPIVINGLAMTNYMMSGNVFNGVLFSTGTTFPGITTAVDVTGGAISGITNACSNQYIGYGTPPDVPDICASPGSWTTNTGTVATLNQASTLAMAGNTFNFSGGNVGIGRTPAVNLDILGTGNTYLRLTRPDNSNDGVFILAPAGALSAGNSQYSFGPPGGSANFVLQQYNGTTPFDILTVNENTHRATFGASTPVTMSNYGAGTATFDASGNITSVSDPRKKDGIKRYRVGLKEVMQIHPITFNWTKESGYDTEHRYAGFNAKEVFNVFGELGSGQDKDGFRTLQDRTLLAALYNAVQEQQKMIEQLQKEIIKLKRK